MKEPAVVCRAERRRHEVRKKPDLNGLDFLEVGDDGLTLTVFFLGKAPGEWRNMESHLLRRHFRIEGGRRIRDLGIDGATLHCMSEPEEDDWLEITLNKAGDFSNYRLCVLQLDKEGKKPMFMLRKTTTAPLDGEPGSAGLGSTSRGAPTGYDPPGGII